jgi:periplasmic protein TonB
MPTKPQPALRNADSYALVAPAFNRTSRMFAWVLLLHAGLFFVLHSVMPLAVPSKLSEAISAHIIQEFRSPEPAKPPLLRPPLQTAPATASQPPILPTPSPSALAAIAPVLAAPQLPSPLASSVPSTPSTPFASSLAKAAVLIPASRVDSSCAVPRYPAASERLREEGVVTLRFLISENGQVVSGQVDKSSGYKRLDDAALAALSLCKFKPATVDGKPRQDWSALRYRWELKDD